MRAVPGACGGSPGVRGRRARRRRAAAAAGLGLVVLGAAVATTSRPATDGTPTAARPGPTLYGSTGGSDTAPGTRRRPLLTVGEALARAPDGARILVRPGSYPPLRDERRRPRSVTVRGVGGRPQVAGLQVLGGSGLRLENLRFTGQVLIGDDPFHLYGAADVVISESELSAPGAVCVMVRGGASRVVIRDNHVHDCATGIGGPGAPSGPDPSRILVVRNRLERFSADGIQFAEWDDVVIAGNVIRNAEDPAGVIHNDAIQLTGDSTRVWIRGNRLSDSRGQLLFVQDAVGPIHDVLVENNLVVGADAYAVQAQGATGLRFVNNTVWYSGFGGLLLRPGVRRPDGTRSVPTDTIVANNVLAGFGTEAPAATARYVRNVVRCAGRGRVGPCVTDRAFMRSARGDFAPVSPLLIRRGLARPAPDVDLSGRDRPRAPSIGALEARPARRR